MAELKTKQNNASVTQFIKTIDDPVKRKDCLELMNIMQQPQRRGRESIEATGG
jgi:hypothetical protein